MSEGWRRIGLTVGVVGGVVGYVAGCMAFVAWAHPDAAGDTYTNLVVLAAVLAGPVAVVGGALAVCVLIGEPTSVVEAVRKRDAIFLTGPAIIPRTALWIADGFAKDRVAERGALSKVDDE